MLTSEKIVLFLDRDDIDWGEDWRSKIDESLSTIAFFIPVLTPRYFRSPECRRELQYFAQRVTDLGVKELVLPLLYVDVPSLHEDAPADDLVALVQTFQWKDWRGLRFLGRRLGRLSPRSSRTRAAPRACLTAHEDNHIISEAMTTIAR
jgi:hypothetical protein